MSDPQEEDKPFLVHIGPLIVDIPRSVGFFGGLAAGVAFDLVAPELALFIAAMPFVKLLKRKHATIIERAIAAVFEGASKPVGGDAEATVRPIGTDGPRGKRPHSNGHAKRDGHTKRHANAHAS